MNQPPTVNPSLSRLPSSTSRPQTSDLHAPNLPTNVHLNPGRLLMPTVRHPGSYSSHSSNVSLNAASNRDGLAMTGGTTSSPPHSPRLKPIPVKLTRNRSGSHSHSTEVDISFTRVPNVHTPADTGHEWLGVPLKFDLMEEVMEIEGYQMYAVEKWIVERNRPVTTLTVYTGDPLHKITVTSLIPSHSLSARETQAEWEKALHHLRRDGARPKETALGVIMVTSLAHFRSDLTIVHIPTGNFLDAKEQLFANITLLRMGCSGRSAVTLEESSDTTKERFIAMYHLPETTTGGISEHHVPTTPLNNMAAPQSTASSPIKGQKAKPDLSRAQELSGVQSGRDAVTDAPIITTTPPTPDNSRPLHHDGSFKAGSNNRTLTTTILPRNTTKTKTKDCKLFNATVLEFMKLIQAALAIFGMFPLPPPSEKGATGELDGLLCDLTVEGIQRWVTEVGEPCVGIEPMERVADPIVVAALLSLVLAMRNQLAVIGYSNDLPRDPFLKPEEFSSALGTYIQSTLNSGDTSSYSNSHSYFHSPYYRSHAMEPSTTSTITPDSAITSRRYPILTPSLVETISTAYDRVRQNDARKVHKVIWHKLDDLTSVVGVGGDRDGSNHGKDDRDGGGHGRRSGRGGGGSSSAVAGENSLGIGSGGQILSGIASGLGLGGGSSGAGSIMDCIMDLEVFVKVIVGRGKERVGGGKERNVAVGASVRALWSGRVATLLRMRDRERNKQFGGRQEKKENLGIKGRNKAKGRVWSDGDKESDRERTDGPVSTEDESEILGAFTASRPWSGKVQKKIETWTGLSRGKRAMDASSSLSKATGGRFTAVQMTQESSNSSRNHQATPLQSLSALGTGDGDDDDEPLLSSGQVSPIGDPKQPNPLSAIYGEGTNTSTPNHGSKAPSISDHDRLVKAFNQKRPLGKGSYESRVSSWSDPVSAMGILEEEGKRDDKAGKRRSRSGLGRSSTMGDVEGTDDQRYRRTLLSNAPRMRHSFSDLSSLRSRRVLTVDKMKIDVDLCGQLLIMSRRERNMDNMLSCLQALTSALSATNASLREDYHSHQQALADLEVRSKVVARIESERMKADMTTQETNILLYESEQFHIPNLWHMASLSRQKVLKLREKVFGTGGRRLPPGVSGAHGRFNRLQWTLDGQERLVDWMGRTESEVDEESLLADVLVEASRDEEEDVVEHAVIKPMWLLRFFNSWSVRWGWGIGKMKTQGDGNMEEAVNETSKELPETERSPSPETRGEGVFVSDKSTSPTVVGRCGDEKASSS